MEELLGIQESAELLGMRKAAFYSRPRPKRRGDMHILVRTRRII